MQTLVPVGGIDYSDFHNEQLQSFFEAGNITMIEIYDGVIAFHYDFAAVEKGIAFVRSDRPEIIDGYSPQLSFTAQGNGYLGTQEGSDNSFYYSWIKPQWYYFEERY